jgi:Ca2+-binding RTX toxin-like protein
MTSTYSLKPFYLNAGDIAYLLAQVNFVPLFDGPANSNGIVNFDGTQNAYSAKGVLLWDMSLNGGAGGLTQAAHDLGYDTLADLGAGFPQVSAPVGIREISGIHNNLFGDQAFWGTADVPFRRDIPADFNNYVTSPGANYAPGSGTGTSGNDVIDKMPRIISQTITTGGVNLLKDGDGHFVEWDSALYASDAAYKALIDGAHVNIAQLVEGAKIVAPLGFSLEWNAAADAASTQYVTLLSYIAANSASIDGKLYGSDTGGNLADGGPIYILTSSGYQLLNIGAFNADLFSYHALVAASGENTGLLADGDFIAIDGADIQSAITAIQQLGTIDEATAAHQLVGDSGYGLREQIGHIDFQNPDSGEYFVGSENPGVAPVNSWFGIFGQFFDHGLDFIGKGGNGTITIALDPSDPLYGSIGPDGQPVTAIKISRATIAGTDANGDPSYVNHTSPFIDQSQTYGSSDQITQLLREWVSTDNGATFHAGIELFDGHTLTGDAQWERRWPDGTSEMVDNTLPTLNELRQHVIETGRDALTWEDVLNYRNRDASGHLSDGQSGHALILDMNPHFDGATGPGTGHIQQASIDKLNAAAGTSYTAATFNIGVIMPYVNGDFTIKDAVSAAIHEAVSDILMDSVGDHYIAGDGRVNENFGLTSIHHVFHEEHNYQVENLKGWIYAHDAHNSPADHADLHQWQIDTGHGQDAQGNYLNADGSIAWDADKMFNATKLLVEMEYQHAAVDQYARTVTPRIQEFVGYSTGVDSTISLEYAQVAFRFGHSTIRETIDAVDPSGWMLGAVTRYALEKAFLSPETFADEGVAAITLGLSRQQMNEIDEFVTPALNQGLLNQPLDLPAINIARGRDLGIPTLNDFREGLSLARYTSWSDFGANMIHPESLVNFIAAYSFGGGADGVAKAKAIIGLFDGSIAEGSPEAMGYTADQATAFMLNDEIPDDPGLDAAREGFEHIDSWIGGLAEAHVPGGLLGETFDAVFVAQIQSLMDGDRFYYLYRLFGTNIHEEVNNGQFKDIVERNTGLSHLNGSIFAYADKYYDFNRAKDGTLDDASNSGDDKPNHLYHDLLESHPDLGIYSDGGVSTNSNGTFLHVKGTDGIRNATRNEYIRDVRVEDNRDAVHPVEGTPTSGANSHEVIVATDNVDFIHARGGDDTVYGEDGDDYIYGDGGMDRLYGGAGNDLLDTGEGPDLADGGAGKDIIYGRGSGSEVGGFDQLVGGSGNDLIVGGEGIDKLSGGSGDDIIYGDGLTNPEMGNTDPFTHGGDGNDYIDGGASGDLLYGEEGDDYLVGGIDQDLIQGGVGDDIIRPGTPSQAINGGPDEVIGDDGYSNTGYDLIDFSDYAGNAPGVTIDFATQTNPLPAIDGTTPFPAWFQIEGAIGSRNKDTFVGDSDGDASAVVSHGSNWLIGGSGNDIFTGNGGNDVVIGDSIRLDALIGKYSDAEPQGNLVVGSKPWLKDAMHTGGTTAGYGNDAEDAYTGASNRAEGSVSGGLLAAAGFDLHFTEMLRSRMFKDLVLGDDKNAGSNDTVTFAGARNEYEVKGILADGTIVTDKTPGIVAYLIKDLGGIDLATGLARADDGTDFVLGVENFRFADATVTVADIFNHLHTGTLSFRGTTGSSGFNPTAVLTPYANIYDADNVTPGNPTGAVSIPTSAYQWYAGTLGAGEKVTWSGTPIATGSGLGQQSAGHVLTQGQNTAGRLVQLTASYTDAKGYVETVTESYNLIVGSNSSQILTGADIAGVSDADAIFGLGGNDTLNGGAGNDKLYGGSGDDTLDGGDGIDTAGFGTTSVLSATFDAAAAGIVVHSGGGDDDTLANIERVEFNEGTFNLVAGSIDADALAGGIDRDLLLGFDGNDTLTGGKGNDVIDGGSVADPANNPADVDTAIFADDLASVSFALSGSWLTVTTATEGVDSMRNVERITLGATTYGLNVGGNGTDVFNAATPPEIFLGFNGTDTVVYSGNTAINASLLTGTATNGDRYYSIENLTGGNGGDTLAGNGSANALIGNGGNDTLNGDAGNDTLDGGSGNNTLSGGAGNDTLVASTGNSNRSTMDGGADVDTVDYSAFTSALTVTLNGSTVATVTGTAGGGGSGGAADTIVNIENFFAGSGNDSITGDGGANDLRGGAGNDTIRGGAGADAITGGAGNDNLDGEAGNDTYTYAIGDGADTVNDTGGDAADVLAITGGNGDDALTVTYGGSQLTGVAGGTVAGVERINANLGGGTNTLSYGTTTAAVTVNLSNGTASGFLTALGSASNAIQGVDNVTGGTGNDSLTGDSSANTLVGGGGTDTLSGGSGNDTLDGGTGNDTLNGGSGTDIFTGGAGNDVFDFNAGDTTSSNSLTNNDRITDFTAGDVIDLAGIDAISGGGDNAFSATLLSNAGHTAVNFSAMGQLRYYWQDAGGSQYTVIEGNTSGGNTSGAEFRIVLNGHLDLTAADFVL